MCKPTFELPDSPMPSAATKTAYIALGSNLGSRRKNIEGALKALASQHKLQSISSIYESPPLGPIQNQNPFLNAAASLQTQYNPQQLLKNLQQIEKEFGRKRTQRWGPRTLDIDLLLYEQIHIREPELTLPHSEMHRRGFVLIPLIEIAPELQLKGQKLKHHLKQLDKNTLQKFAPAPQLQH